jgi:tripartite-type tricarboxylate transporter receptor subunit TctC
MLRFTACLAALLSLLIAAVPHAAGQSAPRPEGFPNKLVRIIVPYGTGGAADLLARVVGAQLSTYWGQPVIVENRPGGNGAIGIEQVIRSAPDGYTMGCIAVSNLVVNPHLYSNLRFDVFTDLAPVSLIAQVQNVLVVGPALEVSNVRQLIDAAKSKPGTITYGSPGVGSQAHIAGEMFNSLMGVSTTHIPYNGVGAAMKDVLGGSVTLMFAQMQAALPLVNSGKVKALAVASPTRSAHLPNVPTILEQTGVQGFDTVAWSAFMAPAGTPEEVRSFIASEIKRALKVPEVQERLRAQGAEPVGSTPAELAHIMKTEHARYGEIIKKARIRLE